MRSGGHATPFPSSCASFHGRAGHGRIARCPARRAWKRREDRHDRGAHHLCLTCTAFHHVEMPCQNSGFRWPKSPELHPLLQNPARHRFKPVRRGAKNTSINRDARPGTAGSTRTRQSGRNFRHFGRKRPQGPRRNGRARQAGRPRRREPGDVSDQYRRPAVLSQSRRLSVCMSDPYAGAGVHPADRPGPVHRCLHAELGVERLPGHPGPRVRPPVRASLPPRSHPGRRRDDGQGSEPEERRARRHLPAQTCRGRLQGRDRLVAAERAGEEERQARRADRRGAGFTHGGARPAAARLSRHAVREGPQRRRSHADQHPLVPPAGAGARRGGLPHRRHGR